MRCDDVIIQAHQLEEREKDLRKRDALYKEHIAKLEAKVRTFYRYISCTIRLH